MPLWTDLPGVEDLTVGAEWVGCRIPLEFMSTSFSPDLCLTNRASLGICKLSCILRWVVTIIYQHSTHITKFGQSLGINTN